MKISLRRLTNLFRSLLRNWLVALRKLIASWFISPCFFLIPGKRRPISRRSLAASSLHLRSVWVSRLPDNPVYKAGIGPPRLIISNRQCSNPNSWLRNSCMLMISWYLHSMTLVQYIQLNSHSKQNVCHFRL